MTSPWLEILDEAIRACATHGRPDLVEHLRLKRGHLLDPKLRALVVGGPGQGKSQLVNALVNAPVCAVGDDITTAVTTVIQHADTPSATLISRPARTMVPAAVPTGPERIQVPVEQVANAVGRRAGARGQPEYIQAEIGMPRALLATGLVLVDTPGAGGLRTALPSVIQADVVVMASEGTHELSAGEFELLTQIAGSCAQVILAVTKIDIAPQWRQVVERNRKRLADAGIAARVIPVSAALRLRAAQTDDKILNNESGFPALIASLQGGSATKANILARRAAGVVVSSAVTQLIQQLETDLSSRDRRHGVNALSRLQEAQAQAADLRKTASRWQNVLADEMTDLASEIEYDLRDRTRQILRRVDEIFYDADPVLVWDTFGEWLADNLWNAAEANFALLIERCEWAARRVARNFPMQHGGFLPDTNFEAPSDLFACVTVPEKPRFEKFTLSQMLLSGLRGSYGGLLMIGLVTSLAGLPLINPFSVSAGTVFGIKTVRDESDGRRKQRQAAARAAAQRHVDDFFLRFSKDCKDIARHLQRKLRDNFSALTEELQESIVESAKTAKQDVDTDATERDRRDREISRELQRLNVIEKQARAMLTAPAAIPQTVSPAVAQALTQGVSPAVAQAMTQAMMPAVTPAMVQAALAQRAAENGA